MKEITLPEGTDWDLCHTDKGALAGLFVNAQSNFACFYSNNDCTNLVAMNEAGSGCGVLPGFASWKVAYSGGC